MQLKTQYWLSAALSTGAIAAVAVTLVLSLRHVEVKIAESNFGASLIAEGISGLRLLTMEYVLYQRERVPIQWQQQHDALRIMLDTPLFQDTPEQSILQSLIQRHRYAGAAFDELVSLHRRQAGQSIERALAHEVQSRLASQIMLATQDMVVDATRLSRISHDALWQAQRRSSTLLLVLVVVIGCVVAFNAYLVSQLVLRPIARLKRGAELLGAGQLGHRTALPQANEFGALSQAFDDMAASLAETHAALERRTTQLEVTNAELESFSYSVSHDLRAPLRGIDGWSLALLEDLDDKLDDEDRKHLNIVRSETQRMGRLIDDLLALSRVSRSQTHFEPVDLSALARTVADRLRQALPERNLRFVIQPGLQARCDARLMDVTLTNLFDNACKFTGQRSQARIEFGRLSPEDVKPTSPGDSSHLQDLTVYFVRDNGVGFDMACAQRLFGSFQRLHRASEFPGNGIGLATVRRIVRMHQGEIWADAKPDQGASFYFTLREPA